MRHTALILVLFLTACGGGNNAAESQSAQPAPRDRSAELSRARDLHARATRLTAEQKPVEAIPLLEQAVELAPENASYCADLAKAYLEVRRNAEAREYAMRAAKVAAPAQRDEIQGYAALASHRMASEAYRANEDKLAREHLRDALELRPSDGDLNLLLGYIEFRRKVYDEAEAAFRLAADVTMGAPRREALHWMGQAQFAQEQYEEAASTYTGLINEGVTAHDVYGWRAYCHTQLGRGTEARRDFELAAEYASSPDKRKEYLEAASRIAQDGG
jgi:Flp pilus assembly protein TadD